MKNGTEKGVGLGMIALLPICCIGLTLVLAAGISAAALAWGGALVGGIIAVTVFSAVLLRRRARTSACRVPGQPRDPAATRLSEEVAKR